MRAGRTSAENSSPAVNTLGEAEVSTSPFTFGSASSCLTVPWNASIILKSKVLTGGFWRRISTMPAAPAIGWTPTRPDAAEESWRARSAPRSTARECRSIFPVTEREREVDDPTFSN